MSRKLDEEVWRRDNDWDFYNFLRGQHDVLERMMRAPVEVERLIQELKEE